MAKSKLLVVGRVLMMWGLVLMLAGAALWASEWKLSRARIYAQATVAANEEQTTALGVQYFPRFRFVLADGTIVQVVGRDGAKDAAFAVGETVRVAYPAGTPQQAVVATVWTVYSGAILCGVFGVGLFDGGVVIWWLGRRRLLRTSPGGNGQSRKRFAGLFGENGGYRP